MNLKEKIEQEYLVAFKNKEELKVAVLRLLKTAVKNKEIEKKSELSEADYVLIIRSEVKKRKDSIESYNQGGRQDLADRENLEKQVLEKYLPAQLGEADIKNKIEEIIKNLPVEQQSNFGVVMGKVIAGLKGQADGGLVSRLVKELIS